MARGYPDYGMNTASYGQFILDGSEIAARINARSRYDRKGNVIFWDNFEDGLSGWWILNSGVGIVKAKITNPYDGGASVEIDTGVFSGGSMSIIKSLPFIEAGIYGLECMFAIDGDPNPGVPQMFIQHKYNSGSINRSFTFTIYPDDGYIQLLNGPGSPGSYVTVLDNLGDMRTPLTLKHFHYIKTTFDIVNARYGRIIFNNFGANLGQYSAITEAIGIVNEARMYIGANSQANRCTMVIDNVVVTMNEPL